MHTINQIADGFSFVERGWLNGNHFVFNREETVLIDTAYIKGFEETGRILDALGVNRSRISRIITTHTHCDHVGGHACLQEASGCEILLSVIDKHFIDTRNDWYTWWRYYDQEARFFRTGPPLHDGDILTVGDMEFQVVHTPGHASGGIVLFNPDSRMLISSDALWANDIGALTPRIEGNMCVFQALASLDRIERLKAEIAYPGHGEVIRDVGAAVERCRRRLKAYLRNPRTQGMDQIKKIMVYLLLMKDGFPEENLFAYLMSTPWFPETVELFFDGRFEPVYKEAVDTLLERGAVYRKDGRLLTSVRP